MSGRHSEESRFEYKRVMIDIETMGLSPDAAITSIGAVVFDVYTGFVLEEFSVNVELKSCQDIGLSCDAETIEFWNRPENLDAYVAMSRDTVPITKALHEFSNWLLQDTRIGNVEVWANGVSFDLAVLRTAYLRTGVEMPWRFYNERDYRTMKNLYRDVPKPSFDGIRHLAVDDARYQAEHLLRILAAVDA